LFAAPLAQTARVLDALRQKAEQDPSVLRGGAGTPAAAAQPEEETAEPVAAPVESDSTTTEAVAEDTAEAPAEDTTEG
jgi:large subunit ribosomal protein L10